MSTINISSPILFKIRNFVELENGQNYIFQIGSVIITINTEYFISFTESVMTFNQAKQTPFLKANSKQKVLLRENSSSSNTFSQNEVQADTLPKLKSNFNVTIDDPSCESQAYIKISSTLFESQEFTIPSSKLITKIGRSNKNDIICEGTDISKSHCMICFNKSTKKWRIYDGYENSSSSNGTWMVVSNRINLEGGMSIFRFGKYKFVIDYFKTQDNIN